MSQQYEKAKKYLSIFQKIVEDMRELPLIRQTHLNWYQVDSAQGNWQSALVHYKQYKALNDSIINESKIKEIAQLQIQYDTEQKNKDIKLKEQSIALLTKQGELQLSLNESKDRDLKLKEKDIALLTGQQELQAAAADRKDRDLRLKDQNIKLKEKDIALLTQESLLHQARLQETKRTRNFIIGGAVMLLLLLTLGYSRYQTKQKASREINNKNLALQRLVDEKEWLLKEIHHRVKNNLQTVVSLLESQSAYLQDDALLAIQDSQNRVYAMSLIHQKLYQTENVAAINMASYLPELVNYLRDSFSVRKQTHFDLRIMSIELDVSQAIPIGLILNEAITNCIKYAFAGQHAQQVITICMEQVEAGRIALSVSDNGIGLPVGFDEDNCSGLGLRLMKGLTEDIEGQFIIKHEAGTTILVTFMANIPLYKSGEATLPSLMSEPA